MRRIFFILAALAFLFPCAGTEDYAYATKAEGDDMAITITSSAFTNGGMIPKNKIGDRQNM
jgi:ABC-type glycerol-3-phosphate transport system substrate-binding protein